MRTEEQEIIIDRLQYINNSIGIKAFAGTGKSFLLREATLEYPKLNFLGLAFNSSIVEENSQKFPKKNSVWFTVHGLARSFFQSAKYDLGVIKKNDYTIIDIIDILKIKNNDYVLSSVIIEIFNLFCNSDEYQITVDGILKAAYNQKKNAIACVDKEVLEVACIKAKELWNLFLTKKIQATHSFYLKLFQVKNLATKINKFDFILLDEAQDTNPVTLSILKQIPAKKIFVGDPHQSIYAFRGVLNAIAIAEEQHYLSSTFRYQNHIADIASDLLLSYKNEKKRITSLASSSKEDKSHAILFRNNSTMIEAIGNFMDKNINYKTFKDPKELFKTALTILEFRTENKYPSSNDFRYFKKFKNYEELNEYIKESGDKELSTANKMQQRYGKGLYRYYIDARNKYKEKQTNHIILCTGHISKGLEWGKVDIYSDFPDIQKLFEKNNIVNALDLQSRADENDTISNEILQEINLKYVAITRAKHTIHFHKETMDIF